MGASELDQYEISRRPGDTWSSDNHTFHSGHQVHPFLSIRRGLGWHFLLYIFSEFFPPCLCLFRHIVHNTLRPLGVSECSPITHISLRSIMITVIVTKCVNKKHLCRRRRNELVSETWPLSTLSSHDPSNLRSSQSCYQQYLESRRYLAKNTFNFVVMITVDTETIFTDVALITLRRMCEILDCSQVSFEDQIPTNVHKWCLFRILYNSFISSAFGHFVVHQTYHGLPHVKRSLKHQLWSCW